MLRSVLGIAAVGALFAAPVMAAEGEGFFASNALRLGGGIGLNYVTDDVAGINFDERATALEAFVGYEFNKWLAVEGGYLNGGSAAESRGENGAYRVESEGYYATVLGSLPVTDTLSFYARAGILQWDGEASLRFSGQRVQFGKDDGNDPIYGIGAAAEVEGALLRLEYRMADISNTKMKLITLAIAWRIPLGR